MLPVGAHDPTARTFPLNIEVGGTLLLTAFVMSVVLGFVTNKTNFCTMGAVSDWVNMGDTGRLRAWLGALAVAILGVTILESMAIFDLNESRIPYRSSNFAWPRYLLGGLMFGVGMSLAGGCASKNLVRLGGGNLKSLIVVVVIGAFAYLMTRTDFYGIVFLTWMGPLTPDLAQMGADTQEMAVVAGALTGAENVDTLRWIIGGLLVLGLGAFAVSSADFRRNADNWIAAIVVGGMVVGGWYLTGGPAGQEWIEAAEFADRPPEGVGVQSFTFVNPAADLLAWVMQGGDQAYLTFGIALLFGMIVGSAVYAVFNRGFRIEWFSSWGDFMRHIVGGALMGLGGVLALGCTVGQGVSGFSSMALGSPIAMVAIMLSSALTIKTEYYKILYEDASTGAAFVSALADMRLVPQSMRKLEAL